MQDVILEASMGMKCTDIAQATLARLHKREYRLMFADCWKFSYIEDESIIINAMKECNREGEIYPYKDTIGLRLSGKVEGIDENLYKYHGIKTSYYNWKGKELIDNTFQMLNAGGCVGMWYDQFYMPWAKEMRKKAPLRYDGFFVLLEYKEYINSFLCIDIHGSRKIEVLPFEIFQQFVNLGEEHKIIVYEIFEERRIEYGLKENISIQLKRVGYGTGNSICDKMRKFSRFVKENLDFEKEVQYSLLDIPELSAPTHIDGVKRIRDVARMRTLYSITLEYYAEHNPLMKSLASEFKIAASNWQNIVSVLVKASYLKENKGLGETIAGLILKCADYEEYIMEHMQSLLKTMNEDDGSIEEEEEVGKQQEFLYLKKFFNNKAFAKSINNVENADIDGMGNFMICEKKHKTQENNLFSILETEKYDNVVCCGQNIKMDKTIESMSVIGTCDSGAYYGGIKIIYQDDIVENKVIGFGEWRFDKCELGERLVWSGERVYFGMESKEEQGHIFENVLNGFRKCKIKEIVLPLNSHIHIFGITYVAKEEKV